MKESQAETVVIDNIRKWRQRAEATGVILWAVTGEVWHGSGWLRCQVHTGTHTHKHTHTHETNQTTQLAAHNPVDPI